MTEVTAPEARLLDPFQAKLLKFVTRLITEAPANAPDRFRYEITLQLTEALGEGLDVIELSLMAEGGSALPIAQSAVIDIGVDLIIEALARERSGIRPGSQTPAEIVEAMRALGFQSRRATQ